MINFSTLKQKFFLIFSTTNILGTRALQKYLSEKKNLFKYFKNDKLKIFADLGLETLLKAKNPTNKIPNYFLNNKKFSQI